MPFGRHPPLRRVSRGRRVSIGHQPSVEELNSELNRSAMEQKNADKMSVLNQRISKPAELQDSCYSSCSDSTDSHLSLSRECSDTLASETEPQTPVAPPQKSFTSSPNYNSLLQFSLRLGYTEQQLEIVMKRLITADTSSFPDQDRILSELISLRDLDGLNNRNEKQEKFDKNTVINVALSKQGNKQVQLCPYGRKCTFGNKCRFAHPERPGGVQVSVSDRLNKQNRERRPLMTSLSLDPRILEQRSQEGAPKHSSDESIECSPSPPSSVSPLELSPHPTTPNRLAVPPAWPWSCKQTQHAQLSRVNSAPQKVTTPAHPNTPKSPLTHTLSSSPQHQQINNLKSAQVRSQPNFFVPSSTVWGEAEYSLLPRNTMTSFDNLAAATVRRDTDTVQERQKIEYHLSQLFPVGIVRQVMAKHPNEMSSERLCRIILHQLQRSPNT